MEPIQKQDRGIAQGCPGNPHRIIHTKCPLSQNPAPRNPATGSALYKEITAAQRRGYDDFAKNFDPDVDTYTWNDVRAIEVEAHTSVGFSQSEAEVLTDYGIEKLKQQGLSQPTNIPWDPGVL